VVRVSVWICTRRRRTPSARAVGQAMIAEIARESRRVSRRELTRSLVRMHRHRLTGLAALISLVLAVGIGTSVAVAGGGEPPSDGDGGPNWFSDLDDAARRGAIDLELVRRLADGERVDAFIVLDGKAVMSAYGDGSVRGVAAAKAQVSAMREGLLGDVPVDVLVSYEVVPLLLVQLEYESQALALLNSSFVKAITADNQNEPALAQSLPLIRQPQVAAM
jgi:hypothetical protein